jgi:uncharacterized OB-fold protein
MAMGTVPLPTPETAAFWEGTSAGELRLQRCNSCGRFYFYPRPFCRYCASPDVAWETVSGSGRLVSYVINYRPVPPADEPAQVIALIELDEGPRMMSNLVGSSLDPDEIPLGAAVRVSFVPCEEMAIPVFSLVEPT